MKLQFLIHFICCVKISFGISFCVDIVNQVFPINKLQTVPTLHCTLYTVDYAPYRLELGTQETSKERGHM